jgi:hypothetical protein
MYIEHVTKVIRRSECMVDQTSFIYSLSVIFEVIAVKYSPGELITGCVITNKTADHTVCKAGYNAILILSQEGAPSVAPLEVGNIITVQIEQTMFTPCSDNIAILARLYVPNTKYIAYKWNAGDVDAAILADTLDKINSISTGGPTWDFFSKLVYPYKSLAQLPAGSRVINDITSVVSAHIDNNQYVYIHPADKSVVCISSERPPDAQIETQHQCTNVLLMLLEAHYAHLQLLHDLTTIHSSQASMESHKILWRIYQKAKADA